MRIEKDKQAITSLATWQQFAGPKSPEQWVEGRSAFELARAWLSSDPPGMILCMNMILSFHSRTATL